MGRLREERDKKNWDKKLGVFIHGKVNLCSVLYPELLHSRQINNYNDTTASRAVLLRTAGYNSCHGRSTCSAKTTPPAIIRPSNGFPSRLTSNLEVVFYAVDVGEDRSPPGVPKAVEGRRILRPTSSYTCATILEPLPLQAELRDVVRTIRDKTHSTTEVREKTFRVGEGPGGNPTSALTYHTMHSTKETYMRSGAVRLVQGGRKFQEQKPDGIGIIPQRGQMPAPEQEKSTTDDPPAKTLPRGLPVEFYAVREAQ